MYALKRLDQRGFSSSKKQPQRRRIRGLGLRISQSHKAGKALEGLGMTRSWRHLLLQPTHNTGLGFRV